MNFGVATLDERLWKQMEPVTPKPSKRLEAMELLARMGIRTGVLLAPIIPGITDSPEKLEAVVKAAAEHGADFLAPNVLRLKHGSREWFMPFVRETYPHLNPLTSGSTRAPTRPSGTPSRCCNWWTNCGATTAWMAAAPSPRRRRVARSWPWCSQSRMKGLNSRPVLLPQWERVRDSGARRVGGERGAPSARLAPICL
ncbi:MAG: hypothetical protein EXR47_00645 [Dehalococcoidia bacterium]|nr:hypothetical protein [Dehalococcoidia bacterium]